MDSEIGRIMAQIRAMKAFENTLVIFLSDNGASAEIMVRGDGHNPKSPLGSADTYPCLGPGWSTVCNTPFRRHKTWVHEGGCATPFIAHWPGGIKERNKLRRTPAHVIDVVPTILELASLELEHQVPSPGRSLGRTFLEDGGPLHEKLWWLHDGHRALRVGDWKLVAAKDQPWELFHLAVDRTETCNLAKEHPEKVLAMADQWNSLTNSFASSAREIAPK
jgi:arylsulfatase